MKTEAELRGISKDLETSHGYLEQVYGETVSQTDLPETDILFVSVEVGKLVRDVMEAVLDDNDLNHQRLNDIASEYSAVIIDKVRGLRK